MNKDKLFSTDALMNSLWQWLVRDYRALLDDPEFMAEEEALLFNKPALRQLETGSYYLSPYLYFKCRYQMESLFKRYIFKSDLYNDDELEKMTNQKFVETQSRVGKLSTPTYRAFLVLQKARSYAKEILGRYDIEEHYQSCRFGKRASVGVPRRECYLDSRLSSPLSGSHAHIKWFKNYLNSDPQLESILCELQNSAVPQYSLCEKLALTNVPKSYKAKRGIMPNTTIGGFYSYGLGLMIQKRLKAFGLDLRRMQEKHRRLVRKYSRSRSHVTADLASASDSFTWMLLNYVIPREWLNCLNFGRIRKADINGADIHLSSFMTMGIGFTFQVQTLVFYCLLKSIQALSKVPGLISVYGDDLIYPARMHHLVVQIFTDLGFQINNEKTFVKESFRESCGADYYCGYDVRPFQPKGTASMLPRKEYLVLLYKTINGLQRRWPEEAVPQTRRYLLSEILRVSDCILQVPPSFPDYSGIHVDRPRSEYLLPWAQVTRREDDKFSLSFAFLKMLPKDRFVEHQAPYLWDKLRSAQNPEELWEFWAVDKHLLYGENVSLLRWIKAKYQPKSYRSRITGKRLRKLVAVQAQALGDFQIVCQTGTTCVWD